MATRKKKTHVRPSTSPSKKQTRPSASSKQKTVQQEKASSGLLFSSPRGMEDVLWKEYAYWEALVETFRHICSGFNVRHISVPVVEDPGLFTKAVGEQTDIIEKEMFFVRDKTGKTKLALRPEFTAGVIRAYLEHGMTSYPQPVRLWYCGPVFRHDRPQAGRLRQHNQFGVEVIGEAHPVIDVQVIHLAYEVFKTMQLESFRIDLNTIGCLEDSCRPAYIVLLQKHLKDQTRKLCGDCRRRAKTNPLRVLDCKEEKCQMVVNTGPQAAEHVCNACKVHHTFIQKELTRLEVPYRDNSRLVRGLDYYTRTVFEFVSTLPENDPMGGMSFAAGGRYDRLVKLLGGPSTPAVGFAGGLERTVLQMKSEGIEVDFTDKPDLFLAHLGDLGRERAMKLFDDLRRSGFRIAEAFHKDGIKAQLRAADRAGIPYAMILGQKEALDSTVILRNMESGIQETIDAKLDALIPVLEKRLRREIRS